MNRVRIQILDAGGDATGSFGLNGEFAESAVRCEQTVQLYNDIGS